MIEKKNIDRLFQEKFKDFEVVPDEKVWENIEAELKEKKKRRIIPFWFRLAGAAAILILGGVLLYKMTTSGNGMEGKIVNGGKNPVENNAAPNSSGNPSDNSSDKQIQSLPIEKNTQEAVASENQDGNSSDGNNPNGSSIENPSDSNQNPSEKPSQIQKKNKRINTNSSSAVAGSDETQTKNQSGEATNRTNSRLENNAGNGKGENAIVHTQKKNKKAGKDKNNLAETQSNETVAQSDKNANSTQKQPQQEPKTNTSLTNEAQLANQSKVEKPTQEQNNGEPKTIGEPTENTSVANTNIKKDSTAIATVAPNALEELLNEKENKVTATEQKVNRWQVTSNVAPIYFSSTSNGSPLDSRFEGNKKTYAPSVSYGVGAKYALSKKFFIKSGVNSVSLEYNTSDVLFFQTANAQKIQNVTPNIQGSLIQVDNLPASGFDTFGRTIRQFSGDLNQRLSYVEIPMEMSYQLLDRKFGVELIGGLSTLILNKNEVSLVSSGMDMMIGEANNLNSLHFSTNVGVGFKYKFLKRLEANFEPMFKYQINTFSEGAGNFKPYFFGLYTGLSYRF